MFPASSRRSCASSVGSTCMERAGGVCGLKAMAFRVADQELGRALLNAGGRTVALAGRLRVNEWMGKSSVELQIDDAAAVED